MRLASLTIIATLISGCNVSKLASDTHPVISSQPAPAFLLDTSSNVVTSSARRTYQISVALPDGYTKEHTPYPVLYMADANGEFGTVVETARLLAFGKDIPDLVIVGIGYPNPGQGFKASNAARTLDLTPVEDPAWVRAQEKLSMERGLPPAQTSGWASAFLMFIRNELVPSIEKTYNVSRQDRAWFGHSFGGLFGAYALFHNDGLFNRFIIGSPSLWWNNRTILSIEDSFGASKKPLPAKLFFAVGLLEQSMAPEMPMVSDLREFSDRLKRRNYAGLELQTHFFEDEDHGSVVAGTISKGLRYIYSNSTH
jgi:predicted alpha/beta superfamily hydrolase